MPRRDAGRVWPVAQRCAKHLGLWGACPQDTEAPSLLCWAGSHGSALCPPPAAARPQREGEAVIATLDRSACQQIL